MGRQRMVVCTSVNPRNAQWVVQVMMHTHHYFGGVEPVKAWLELGAVDEVASVIQRGGCIDFGDGIRAGW